jgi:hypothetical protein
MLLEEYLSRVTTKPKYSGVATSMDPDQPAHPQSDQGLPTLIQVEKLTANSMNPCNFPIIWIHAGCLRTLLVLS